jgi:hypothetical protein
MQPAALHSGWHEKMKEAAEALRDKHMVVGIIECKPDDDFTRPQRRGLYKC